MCKAYLPDSLVTGLNYRLSRHWGCIRSAKQA